VLDFLFERPDQRRLARPICFLRRQFLHAEHDLPR
jgi:hypothetical protein